MFDFQMLENLLVLAGLLHIEGVTQEFSPKNLCMKMKI